MSSGSAGGGASRPDTALMTVVLACCSMAGWRRAVAVSERAAEVAKLRRCESRGAGKSEAKRAADERGAEGRVNV